MSPSDLKGFICSIFEDRYIRLTPPDLERMVRRSQPGFSPRAVRSAIKEMVAQGTLFYSNHFNTTHIELNYCRPVRVSPRIILVPHGQRCVGPLDGGTQTIVLFQGSAFGIGDHPTTRLALRAVDRVLSEIMAEGWTRGVRALDIGTGSGVLAVAAAKLGADKVVALDIDPLALHEARNNIHLNQMDRSIVIMDVPVENLAGTSFDLIMANLRPPTLRQMMPLFEALSSDKCHWIISGFRQEATEAVARILPQKKTELLKREASCGWGALTARYFYSDHRAGGKKSNGI
jgi:ribosomal protein L11 methyltransferase